MPPTVFGSGKLIVIFVFAAVAGLVVGTSFAESLGIYQLRYTFLAQRTLMTGSTPTPVLNVKFLDIPSLISLKVELLVESKLLWLKQVEQLESEKIVVRRGGGVKERSRHHLESQVGMILYQTQR